MWVAHFAPSLLLARFAPSTPLWALAFAGALPDFLFFALNIAGLEYGHSHTHAAPSTANVFGFDIKGSTTNCLPYSAFYPYTHSTAGQVSLAVLFGIIITLIYRLPPTSFAALVLATLSHLPLDIAISRDESGVTGSEYTRPIWKRDASVPLLDYPWGTFTSDFGIFLFAILFHARTVYPPEEYQQQRGQPNVTSSSAVRSVRVEKKDLTSAYFGVLFFAAVLQAHFSFWGGPVERGDWVTAAVFMAEIVVFAGTLNWLEGYTKVDAKVDEVKKTN
ncbi:hypothetical protein TWF281_002437 [Arthrobotrys megalospora]